MKRIIFSIALIAFIAGMATAKGKTTSGNPVFPGWYADPEGTVMDGKFWIFPTYSAPFDEQTFMDAFSSPDLVNWTKHPRVLEKANVSWARRAMWAPAIVKKDNKYYLFFILKLILH